MTFPFEKAIYVTKPLAPDHDKFDTYFQDILESKQFSNNGKYVIELEDQLRKMLRVDHATAFCNGTTALMIALRSLDLMGYVVTTPFTFPATSNVLPWLGLTPIFCDIDYDTLNITPEEVEAYLDIPHTAVQAILPVHIFGNPCDVYGFDELSDRYNLRIIYDAAHAFNTCIEGQSIAKFGDVTMFSFHPTKLFHTSEGGMLVCNNDDLGERIRQLRNFGIKDDITGSILAGINGKMNELQAITGLCVLDKIDKEYEARRRIFQKYILLLNDIEHVKIFSPANTTQNSWQSLPIRVLNGKRNQIYEYLKACKVFARKYFYPLCSDFPHFKHFRNDFPNAKRVSEEILCLPFYGEMEDDVEAICDIIKEA